MEEQKDNEKKENAGEYKMVVKSYLIECFKYSLINKFEVLNDNQIKINLTKDKNILITIE